MTENGHSQQSGGNQSQTALAEEPCQDRALVVLVKEKEKQ